MARQAIPPTVDQIVEPGNCFRTGRGGSGRFFWILSIFGKIHAQTNVPASGDLLAVLEDSNDQANFKPLNHQLQTTNDLPGHQIPDVRDSPKLSVVPMATATTATPCIRPDDGSMTRQISAEMAMIKTPSNKPHQLPTLDSHRNRKMTAIESPRIWTRNVSEASEQN